MSHLPEIYEAGVAEPRSQLDTKSYLHGQLLTLKMVHLVLILQVQEHQRLSHSVLIQQLPQSRLLVLQLPTVLDVLIQSARKRLLT